MVTEIHDKLRFTIMAIGSRGDVQPLVALGSGLRDKGYQVQIVAGDEFDGLIKNAELEFIPLGLNIQKTMESHTNIFTFMADIKESILSACDFEQDAILSTFLGVSTCPLARARKIPYFYVVPMPGLRTREFPHPLFPTLPLGKTYNALTYRLADRHITQSYEDARCLFLEPRPTYLFCFSPHVIPRPSDWGEFAHVPGYWFLDRPSGWRPPEALEAFLKAGPPPVYVGFGSTLTKDAQRLTKLVLDALEFANQRAVLVTGWGGLITNEESPDVYIADSIPFDWLFPQVAAAIHHGGAGTTSAALRAGIPSVIVPFGVDQSFWGRRMKELGAVAKPIPPRQLTPKRLEYAIRHVLEDNQIRGNAKKVGELIHTEDGVSNAITIIEQVVDSFDPS